jgi:hypothetical protein
MLNSPWELLRAVFVALGVAFVVWYLVLRARSDAGQVDEPGTEESDEHRRSRLRRAYSHANRGDELMTESKVKQARKEYSAASKYAPEIVELPFWHAVTLAATGREDEAAPIFKAVFEKEPVWVELLEKLPAAGLFPDDPALIERIKTLVPRR